MHPWFSMGKFRYIELKGIKIPTHAQTTQTKTRTNKHKQTKQVHNFIIKIGFRNLKKIVGYCLTSSCKAIQKRINGNIKVYGSHLKF